MYTIYKHLTRLYYSIYTRVYTRIYALNTPPTTWCLLCFTRYGPQKTNLLVDNYGLSFVLQVCTV